MPQNDQVVAYWALGAIAVLVLLFFLYIWGKGRPFTKGNVFRASRISSGNRVFPTQVAITPTSVVQYTPHWIGKSEETIHMAHISSVRIDTGLILSDMYIETSGGASPIRCHGHRKGDAVRMKELIEQYQSDYFRASGRPATGTSPPAP